MIDFENHPGKFLPETEPKIAWAKNDEGKYEFIFKKSFEEMHGRFQGKSTRITYGQAKRFHTTDHLLSAQKGINSKKK